MAVIPKNCAVYTRKSSEEGLEQDFNSLDAQREACLAYISSQKSEGWIAVKSRYDDGGFSGGNVDRPALKKLLEDIQAGKINIIVVYKIDRLTRSLVDFAKLVEVFDRHGVTFVSVTQSFNTTTSMGRLTLNVLLSFAQFEREVTGERIRDKIAASKKKGMWMGGVRPTGYDINDQKLVVNDEEADLIRLIFKKYIELGSVPKLKAYLDVSSIRTKGWISRRGSTHGSAMFSRGLLYTILGNPVYIGKIRHKDKVYDGQHESILSREVWDKTQKLLESGTVSTGKKPPVSGNLLKGKLFDCEGNAYSPVFTGKGSKQYRYYVNQSLLQNRPMAKGLVGRIPAQDIETLIELAVRKVSSVGEIKRVIVCVGELKVSVSSGEVSVPFSPVRTGSGFTISDNDRIKDPLDLSGPQLRALVRGIVWRDKFFAGMSMREISERERTDESYVRHLIARSFDVG